ncbi:MAG: GlsB/YeaQ/YmgE family stress response membrane protein [Kangiellaceae bacterium]|nr:GlsB/YeaQ/YmgE family stress response membrane protein [Kangiellaceae bacterium]
MSFITWILVGLVAGILAKFIMPGPDNQGWVMTIVLGVVGAFLGGYLAEALEIGGKVTGFNVTSLVTATVGALIILALQRFFRKK